MSDSSNTEEVRVLSLYHFTQIPEPGRLRQTVIKTVRPLCLSGTILIAAEGINVNVAGTESSVNRFLEWLKQKGWMNPRDVKIYSSPEDPFRRLLVKVRREIISLGRPEIQPSRRRGRYVEPSQFKEWLDRGVEMVVLDTRNRYETRIGKFRNAVDLGLDSFQQFADRIGELDSLDKNARVVMYCTGGIRCEKASLVMEEKGFENVYQLQGGILKFNEQFPNSYFEGSCFVFDHRVAVTADNQVSDYYLCSKCGNPTQNADDCLSCGNPAHVCNSCLAVGPVACSKRCYHDHVSKKSVIEN